MPKRNRQSDDEESFEQAVKKQVSLKNNEIKIRDIKNLSSEKTINMLFKAASQKSTHREVSMSARCSCPRSDQEINRCYFCDKMICLICSRPCDICQEKFCENCSSLMYDNVYDCLCYSCMDNR